MYDIKCQCDVCRSQKATHIIYGNGYCDECYRVMLLIQGQKLSSIY